MSDKTCANTLFKMVLTKLNVFTVLEPIDTNFGKNCKAMGLFYFMGFCRAIYMKKFSETS